MVSYLVSVLADEYHRQRDEHPALGCCSFRPLLMNIAHAKGARGGTKMTVIRNMNMSEDRGGLAYFLFVRKDCDMFPRLVGHAEHHL